MTLALSILLTLGSSPLTANMYPRLEGTVVDKVLIWAHMVWHARRNTALRSSISNYGDKTFMYFLWDLCDALISVLVENHVASSAYIPQPRFYFRCFGYYCPGSHKKDVPNKNAWSYECFEIIWMFWNYYWSNCFISLPKNQIFLFVPWCPNHAECWRGSPIKEVSVGESKTCCGAFLYYCEWHRDRLTPRCNLTSAHLQTHGTSSALLLFRDAWPGARSLGRPQAAVSLWHWLFRA